MTIKDKQELAKLLTPKHDDDIWRFEPREPRGYPWAECPHCHRRIESLQYHLGAIEYGDCGLNRDDHESSDLDYPEGGTERYFCPECGEEIEGALEIHEPLPAPAQETPTPGPRQTPDDVEADHARLLSELIVMPKSNTPWDCIRTIECPKCQELNEIDNKEKHIWCQGCGKELKITPKSEILEY